MENHFRRAKRRKSFKPEPQPENNVAKPTKKATPKNTVSAKNTISQILYGRGIAKVAPTDEFLALHQITARRFCKIVDGKVDMTLTEAAAFAEWLGVTLEELSPNQGGNLAAKFGLNN